MRRLPFLASNFLTCLLRLDETALFQNLVVFRGNGVHGVFGCALSFDNEFGKAGLGDLEQLRINRNIPEILDKGHGFGKGSIERLRFEERVALEHVGIAGVTTQRCPCG